MNPDGRPGSFADFTDLLGGYRLSTVLLVAHQSGVFEIAGGQGCSSEEICARIGWDPAYGRRFLACLKRLGLLREEQGQYLPTAFSAAFLSPGGAHFQGQTLDFERQMLAAWHHLDATLRTGQRVFAVGDKNPAELRQALSLYLGAMDEAARIRAEELWDQVTNLPARGILLDAGAGSGAYLRVFLDRYPSWSGIFCDLPVVVAAQELHDSLATVAQRVAWCACDLLTEEAENLRTITDRSCDLALLSNLVHCQGPRETEGLLRRVAAKVREQGLLLIHDFFSDCGWRGALYDLHMMLNTYNGRTYTCAEMIHMAAAAGFCLHATRSLNSGSTLLAFARDAQPMAFLDLATARGCRRSVG